MGRPSSIIVVNADYIKIAQTFYQYQKRLGYVPGSYQASFNYLNEFLSWLERKGLLEINEIQAHQIQEYYHYISDRPSKQDGGALSPKTTHSHMRILSGFFEMLLQDGQIKTNPTSILKFPYPKETTSERSRLTQEEIKQLYEATETAQEKAILSLAYGCGLRVSELVNCNIEDIKLREKIIIIPQGKGNKRRVVPLSNGVVKDLSSYYYNERENLTKGRDYKPKSTAFMFHSRGGRMQKATYNKMLKMIIDRTSNLELKEKQITIHCLRHSIATHLLEQGMPVGQVRVFLGHSQLETTQMYTHINQKQMQNLMR
ncbi:tyrosine-type recombinase/integrase [Pedobacter sp. ISL-68]|uniref:tyrosine-type recombinase/integrase n=1 Tax=unclassified Pedobacter TaxID=2628915 RepID=UPI001BE5A9B4|nr:MULTISPECIES: tyrosine-type recombinase/integrase [unclassified Pedobacter]MBT2563796.1 tyrosine-type recombinase/integrase [Pedobacter sp. ISL-64]MBT2592798.1 tyrosine-type recombinase/integrase [Pedobacter sp. ISL-68]